MANQNVHNITPAIRARKAAVSLVANCLRQAREAVRNEDYGLACQVLNDVDVYSKYMGVLDAARADAMAARITRRMNRSFNRKAVRNG